MAGSVASKVVFLSDLPTVKLGDKVRFLGCIDRYDTSTATLFLKHSYPHSNHPIVAFTNLDIVLDNVKHTTIQDGGWVNVIGYVTEHSSSSCMAETNTRDVATSGHVHVQAIMLWEAIALKLYEYERVLQDRIAQATRG